MSPARVHGLGPGVAGPGVLGAGGEHRVEMPKGMKVKGRKEAQAAAEDHTQQPTPIGAAQPPAKTALSPFSSAPPHRRGGSVS